MSKAKIMKLCVKSGNVPSPGVEKIQSHASRGSSGKKGFIGSQSAPSGTGGNFFGGVKNGGSGRTFGPSIAEAGPKGSASYLD